MAFAARLLGIPVILHETDASMGLANRLVSPLATRVAFSFPSPEFLRRDRRGSKFTYTGQPISQKFFKAGYGRKHSHPNLLIFGGSQGAKKINDLIREILPDLLERYHVTHVTGARDYGRMKAASNHRCYEPVGFSTDIDALFRQADLIISRAGGSIFEIAATGKPVVLIPIPNAANNHQAINAEIFAERGAAIVLDETKTSSQDLLKVIVELMRNSKKRAELAGNIKRLAEPRAAENVARLILKELK